MNKDDFINNIPFGKEMTGLLDFADNAVGAKEAKKKVLNDMSQPMKNVLGEASDFIGQGAKELGDGLKTAVIKTGDFLDSNPVTGTVGYIGKQIGDVATPNIVKEFQSKQDQGIAKGDAFKGAWNEASLLDKVSFASMFLPVAGAGIKAGASAVLKTPAGLQANTLFTKAMNKTLTSKEAEKLNSFFTKSQGKLQKLFEKNPAIATATNTADDAAKATAGATDDVATKVFDKADDATKVVSKQSEEIAESGLDMSKAADDVAKEATETTTQKLDVSKLKTEGKAIAEAEIKSIEDTIADPIKKSKFKELVSKYGTSIIEHIKRNPVKYSALGITLAGLGTTGLISSDTNDTIKSIDNEQAKKDASALMSKAPDSTISNEAQDQIALTLETRKLPNGLLPHQVISREMGLNWNKSRDEIDDGLKSIGIDLSKVGKPGSSERNIAIANYVVQLKTKYPEKFKQLQESTVSNINP